MSNPTPNITIPVDLTNPGQFFACCGLLELADRLWPGAEGWFEGGAFNIRGTASLSLASLIKTIEKTTVTNTMSPTDRARMETLSAMGRKQREAENLEDEMKALESLRRELPIILQSDVSFVIDWFCDEYAGGIRLKTWAGQQSVLDISQAMHGGLVALGIAGPEGLWRGLRGIGLPFNFDSDLGSQGSALDVGFSFDPLAASESTHIQGTSRPALELLCFIGLQRFRPLEIKGENRFVYSAWTIPAPASIASALANTSVRVGAPPIFEFALLYRTRYLKSFLPAQPYQGDRNE